VSRVQGWSVAGLLFLIIGVLSCSSPVLQRRQAFVKPVPEEIPVSPSMPVNQSVRQIQGILQERGYDPGPLDGVMGKKTRAALQQFQRDQRLSATGQMDTSTKAELFSRPSSTMKSVDEGGAP